MGMGEMLANEASVWGVLAITLVVFMIVLANIKDKINTVIGASGVNGTARTTVDDFITGLSEPKNWVAIVFIALIGFGIIKFVRDR